MNSSVDLSTYLSTTGTGAYSSIVSVYTSGTDPLTTTQNDVVSAYQEHFGVKWAIVGATSTSGLTGVTGGSLVTTEVLYYFFSLPFIVLMTVLILLFYFSTLMLHLLLSSQLMENISTNPFP
jgi:hypothetical protein